MKPTTQNSPPAQRIGRRYDLEAEPVQVPSQSREPSLRDLDDAILRTIAYADIFDYPLTGREIHRYLIEQAALASTVQDRLLHAPRLRQLLGANSPFWFLAGREELVSIRRLRQTVSRRLWAKARRYGGHIAALPFVRMVALTGSLAMNNATSLDDDIDFLVVARSGRVWLARGLAVLLVRLARSQGVYLCPNYVLSEACLDLGRPSLFIAHELAQMVPLFGPSLYRHLLDSNGWAFGYLPNASPETAQHNFLRRSAALGQRCSEAVLGGRLGEKVERWERERKIPRLRQEAARLGGSGAVFTPEACKGHMADHSGEVSRQYGARLAVLGL